MRTVRVNFPTIFFSYKFSLLTTMSVFSAAPYVEVLVSTYLLFCAIYFSSSDAEAVLTAQPGSLRILIALVISCQFLNTH